MLGFEQDRMGMNGLSWHVELDDSEANEHGQKHPREGP
jgi:hypothetical protein